jgi:hypothetical protein
LHDPRPRRAELDVHNVRAGWRQCSHCEMCLMVLV